MKLNELYQMFLEDKKIDVCFSTVETIENRYAVLSKRFGNEDIKNIDKRKVRSYQKYLLEDCDYSVSHVNHLIGLLKQIISFGFENGYIESNSISSVMTINKKVKISKEKVIWNLDQFMIFNSKIDVLRDKVAFNILFFLGLRKGELLSLKWNEVNFTTKTIKIISTANRKKGIGQVVTPPKTPNSNRVLSMNDTLLELLKKYYCSQKKKYKNNINEIYVVGGEKMMSFSTLHRLLDKYLDMVDLPKITLHGFRHSHATMLAEISPDIKAISKRLGHESIEVTVNTYIHTNSKAQIKLANEIEDSILKYGKSEFNLFVDKIKKMLRQEIINNECSNDEMDCIVNLYNYVNKVVIV